MTDQAHISTPTGILDIPEADLVVLDVAAARRFWTKVEVTEACWIWTGSRSKEGYGTFNLGTGQSERNKRGAGKLPNSYDYAHRVSYRIHIGEIPNGLTIDHLCRNRACINPDHLEAVTQRENIRRARFARNGGKCPQGHAYDGVTKAGHRRCSICQREFERQRSQRRRLKRAA